MANILYVASLNLSVDPTRHLNSCIVFRILKSQSVFHDFWLQNEVVGKNDCPKFEGGPFELKKVCEFF